MTTRPVIIVLAAGRNRGAARRAAAPAQDGEPPLMRALRTALGTGLRVLVVVDDPVHLSMAGTQLAARDIVLLPQADGAGEQPGEGDAIAAGVAASGDAGGWVLLPVDAPMVQPPTLLAVAQALEIHPVAFGQHRGRRGLPLGFGPELYSELMQQSGPAAVSRLLARYPAQGVEVDDPAVLGEPHGTAESLRLRAAF